MASVVNSFAIAGIDAYVVTIEADTIFGKPSFAIVGLGDAAIREATQRIESAIINSKFDFPKMKILINLAPSNMKKSGTHFDLPMAIGLLVQSKQVIAEELSAFALIGELSLNGDLRPCAGILPMILEAKTKGIRNIIIPEENMQGAILVKDVNIFGFKTLKEVAGFLDGISTYNNDGLKMLKVRLW